jgi:hypothetical protein
MPKTLITLNVISEKDNSDDIINQLKELFNSNSIGIEFYEIRSIDEKSGLKAFNAEKKNCNNWIEFLKYNKSFN